jgi:hypothetical protein
VVIIVKKVLNIIFPLLILTSVCVIAIPACQSVKPTVTTVTSPAQTTSTPQNTLVTTSFGGVNSASSESADGLSLSLSLDSTSYQPGQAVIITIDETNTLPKTNNVPASDKWPLSALGVGPRGPINYPFGVTIFQGNYSSSDVLFATPLKLYNPQAVYGCPMILSGISTYVFQPSSSTAAIFQNSSASPVLTESMNSEVESMGYWVASPNETLTEFDPGVYTVVGGDEWGSLVVVHFTVSGTSTTTATISTTNTNVTQNQQPIEIVSALGPIPPFTPGGPEIEITLKNVSNEPVVSLTAIFTNLGPRDFDFEFAVSNSNPLLSGISISDSLTLIGAGFDTNVSYPLTIEGTLQNGVTFNYVLQIEIVEPSN